MEGISTVVEPWKIQNVNANQLVTCVVSLFIIVAKHQKYKIRLNMTMHMSRLYI